MGHHMYLISKYPDQGEEFNIDAEQFQKKLLERWPLSKIRLAPPESKAALYWDIHTAETEYFLYDGTLFLTFASFRPTDRAAIIEFVLWFRDLLPDNYPLMFTFDIAETYVNIDVGTSADAVSRSMDELWDWQD